MVHLPIRQVFLPRGHRQRSTDNQRDAVLIRREDVNSVAHDARRRGLLLRRRRRRTFLRHRCVNHRDRHS